MSSTIGINKTVMVPKGFKVVLVPIVGDNVDALLEKLKAGQPILCPLSKRGWLIHKAKAAGVFTKSRQVEEGVLFEPCAPRQWKRLS